MTDGTWSTVSNKGPSKKVQTPATEPTMLRHEWFASWGFTGGSALSKGAVYKPSKKHDEESAAFYRISDAVSKASDKKLPVHVSVDWDAKKSSTQYTKAEAAALMREFHLTVEKHGQDDARNPRFHYIWPDFNNLTVERAPKSSAGTAQQWNEADKIARKFAGELQELQIFTA